MHQLKILHQLGVWIDPRRRTALNFVLSNIREFVLFSGPAGSGLCVDFDGFSLFLYLFLSFVLFHGSNYNEH